MKRYFNIILTLTLAALTSSCVKMMDNAQDVPVVDYVSISYKVSAATGFIPKEGEVPVDPAFSTAGLKVAFRELTSDLAFEGVTDEDGVATVKVIPGSYSITVIGTVENDGTKYYMNGTVPSATLVKDITKAEALKEAGLVIRPAKVGSLMLSELYYAGGPDYYLFDQTYHIYNNGDEVEYLDGLCIANIYPSIVSSSLPVWPDEEGVSNYVYGDYIWQFPGNGTDYPLQPGEAVCLAAQAQNHLLDNPGSINTALADWEFWTGSPIRNNPDVDNMDLLFASSLNKYLNWMVTVDGGAYCIFRPDDGTKLDVAYYEDEANICREVNKSAKYGRIKASWIIDGVELFSSMSQIAYKRMPGYIDAGGGTVNGFYNGKSLCRKVIDTREDGSPIFADTNNSTEDFEIQDIPLVRRHGQKVPAWSIANQATN